MPTKSELETAKSGHQVFDLVGGRGSAGLQIALNAKPRKKGQHHLRNGRGAIVGFSASMFREKLRQPLFIAALHFVAVYLLHRSPQITPQTTRG